MKLPFGFILEFKTRWEDRGEELQRTGPEIFFRNH